MWRSAPHAVQRRMLWVKPSKRHSLSRAGGGRASSSTQGAAPCGPLSCAAPAALLPLLLPQGCGHAPEAAGVACSTPAHPHAALSQPKPAQARALISTQPARRPRTK